MLTTKLVLSKLESTTKELYDNMIVDATLLPSRPTTPQMEQQPSKSISSDDVYIEFKKEKCEIFDPEQKYTVFDLSQDVMLEVLSYLTMEENLNVGLVCKSFREISKHDRLWGKYLTERFGDLQSIKEKKRKKMMNLYKNKTSRFQEMKLRNAKRKLNKQRKKMKQANRREEKRQSHTKYFNNFKKRVLANKRKKEEAERARKQEERRLYYNKTLEGPQKWCERIYISFYGPLFFLMTLASNLLLALYLDKILPSSNEVLFATLSPFLCLVVPLYFVAGIAAFAVDYMRTLRWNTAFDTVIVMGFVGNLWIPIGAILVALKLFVFSETTLWRAALAPLWVISFIYCVGLLYIHKQLRLRFGLEQKIMYGVCVSVNLVVMIVSGLASAKLDGVAEYSWLQVIFIPIWVLLFCALIAVAIGAYFTMHEAGWKACLFVYLPMVLSFVVPWLPFFILLGLKLDGISSLMFLVVFSPLYFWEFIWFIISFVFGVMVFCDCVC